MTYAIANEVNITGLHVRLKILFNSSGKESDYIEL